MQQAFYEMMISGARDASQRARWIFSVVVVIALIQLAAVHNLVLSGSRSYVGSLVYGERSEKAAELIRKAAAPDATGLDILRAESLKELRSAVIENWVDTHKVNLGLLGIEFDAADASHVGAFALAISLTWLYFAMRRENHLMGRVLQIAASEPAQTRSYVFHALNSSQVFATLSENDGPFVAGQERPDRERLVRWAAWVLSYLPVFTMAAAIAAGIASAFFLDAIFRGDPRVLYEAWDKKLTWPVYLSFGFELVLLIIVWRLCYLVRTLQVATRDLLRAKRDQGWQATAPERSPAGDEARA